MSSKCDYILFCLFGYETIKKKESRYYEEISKLIDREYPHLSFQEQQAYKSHLFQKKMLLLK